MSDAKAAKSKGAKAKPAATGQSVQATFNLEQYVKETKNIYWEQLCVDTEGKAGNPRAVNQAHVDELVTEMEANPPLELQLTTWEDRGTSLSLCCVSF